MEANVFPRLNELTTEQLHEHIVQLNRIIEGYCEQVTARDRIIAAYERLHEERKQAS